MNSQDIAVILFWENDLEVDSDLEETALSTGNSNM